MLSARPILFVVSGPSGAGKGTVLAHLAGEFSDLKRVPTYTTRAPRPHEERGIDYTFITDSEFETHLSTGEIFEYTSPYGDYLYGSPRRLLTIEDPTDYLVELDYHGMLRLKALSARRVVSMFIAPPDERAAAERIEQRHREANLAARVSAHAAQQRFAWAYDYVLLNADKADFLRDASRVVYAELVRRRGGRLLAQRDNLSIPGLLQPTSSPHP